MSNQPMWKRPSGPKPRVYQWSGMWAADQQPVNDLYKVRLFRNRTDALNQAIEYAKETQQ